VRPDSGAASIDGVELEGDGTHVRRRCAYAPGELALYTELRAREHVRWCLRGRERAATKRALDLAESLGLPLSARVRTYSHGMKRQLIFAAALAPDVPVRILDEPTEGLDPTKRGQVLDLLRADARAGRTILLSSHHLGEVDRVCDRLVFLSGGRKIADETAESVDRRARRYLRIEFATSAGAEEIESALASLGASRVRTETVPNGHVRAGMFLDNDDPRAFLAKFAASSRLPTPARVEWGQLSLAELYRDLYGVEGV
jgi:ABC-type multidrug transport system ATPase subunit